MTTRGIWGFAIFVAVVTLALSTAAKGAIDRYWSGGGTAYFCEGATSGAECVETGRGGPRYGVVITREFVSITDEGRDKIVYACRRTSPVRACFRGDAR